MGIITSFLMGVVVGGVATWQFDRLKRGSTTGKQWVSDKIDRLKGQPAEAPDNAAQPPEAQVKSTPKNSSPLLQIKGIGPVFATRLNRAGIFSLADLAALTPERILEIVAEDRTENLADPQDWINQARNLVRSGQDKVQEL